MDKIIQVSGITKIYGADTVLNIESLELNKGESLGIVGNNGAGKTTLFRLLLDLIEPTKGSVMSMGENVARSEHWKSYTGSFLDEGFLIDYLSPDEFFEFVGKLHGLDKAELQSKLDKYDDFFKDEIRGKKKYIRDLSKGNQKKVGIVAALLGEPELLILDEPFANLDPSTQYQLRDELKKLDQETEITMIISSHDIVHVTEFCQRIVVLDKGQIVKDIHTNSETLAELESFFSKKIRGEEVQSTVSE